MEPAQTGEFHLSFEKGEDTYFDDYRYANIKYLSFPQFLEETKKEKIVLYQDFTLNKGGIFWDGSYLLTKYFLREYHNIEKNQNTWILELGAGTSLPSIVLKLMGYKVVITDLKYLQEFVRKNVALNIDIESKDLAIRELDWGKREDMDEIKKISDSFGFIICSELIYIEESFDDLVKTLFEFSSPETQIIFSYRIRMKEKFEGFLEKLQPLFRVTFIEDLKLSDLHPNENLHIMIAQRKP